MRSDFARLLHLAREGDGSALGRLLEAYRSYLTLLARLQIDRRLQGKFDASDVAQDTFLEAQQSIDRFYGESEEELLRWLRGIMANRLAKWARRFYGTRCRDVCSERRLAEELDRSSQAFQALAGSQTSPSENAVRHERAVLLAEALMRLPDDYREVITLRQLEEQRFSEVAENMGRSADSARKLWIRALAALRNMLEGELHDSL